MATCNKNQQKTFDMAKASMTGTGLVYLRYRYYNPATANFISEDSYAGSLERPLSQNKYLYLEGNPVNDI